MKLSVLFTFFALIVLGLSQSLSDLPSCARNCLDATTGDCSLLDARCICLNADYVNSFSCCTTRECSARQQHDSWEWAKQLCSTVKVTLRDQISCARQSNAASSSTTATSDTSDTSSEPSSSSTTTITVTISTLAASSSTLSSAEETPSTAAASAPSTITVTFLAAPPTEVAAPSDSGMKIGVGAQAGIGIGASVGALLLLASIFLWCRRHRARRTNSDESVVAPSSDSGYTAVGHGAHVPELGHREHYAAVGAAEQDGFELSSLPSDYHELPTAFNTPRPRSELVAERAPPAPPAPPRPARSSLVPGEEGENFFIA